MNPKHKLIKRIVAEEGDTIRTLPPYPRKEVVVPKGHVWVEGQGLSVKVLHDTHLWQATSHSTATTATYSGLFLVAS